jgi:hypothetical protein
LRSQLSLSSRNRASKQAFTRLPLQRIATTQ